MTDPTRQAEATEIAQEILTKRGPDRVMEVQRARLWERNPSEWTRYERNGCATGSPATATKECRCDCD